MDKNQTNDALSSNYITEQSDTINEEIKIIFKVIEIIMDFIQALNI